MPTAVPAVDTPAVARTVRAVDQHSPTTGANAANATTPNGEPPSLATLHQDLSATGLRLFGEAWSAAVTWLVALWTEKYTPAYRRNSIDQLNTEECIDLLQGLVGHSAEVQVEWQKHLSQRHDLGRTATQRPAPNPHPAASASTRRTAQRAATEPSNVILATG